MSVTCLASEIWAKAPSTLCRDDRSHGSPKVTPVPSTSLPSEGIYKREVIPQAWTYVNRGVIEGQQGRSPCWQLILCTTSLIEVHLIRRIIGISRPMCDRIRCSRSRGRIAVRNGCGDGWIVCCDEVAPDCCITKSVCCSPCSLRFSQTERTHECSNKVGPLV